MARVFRFSAATESLPQTLASLESQTNLPFEIYDKGLHGFKYEKDMLSYSVASPLQLFRNRPKLVGETPSLGHVPVISAISLREGAAHWDF